MGERASSGHGSASVGGYGWQHHDRAFRQGLAALGAVLSMLLTLISQRIIVSSLDDDGDRIEHYAYAEPARLPP